MVAQENVTLIVTVCSEIENGRVKCHPFWPSDQSDEGNEDPMDFADISATVKQAAPPV